MTRSTALRDLEEAAAQWVVFRGPGAALFAAAAEALAAGEDSPALRELAGMPRDSEYWDVEPLLSRMADEVGITRPAEDSAHSQALALRAESRRFAERPGPGRLYVERIFSALGYHDAIDGAHTLGPLMTAYDLADAQVKPEPTPESVVRLAQWIVELDVTESAARTGRAIPGAPPIEFNLTGVWTPVPKRPVAVAALIAVPIVVAVAVAGVIALALGLD